MGSRLVGDDGIFGPHATTHACRFETMPNKLAGDTGSRHLGTRIHATLGSREGVQAGIHGQSAGVSGRDLLLTRLWSATAIRNSSARPATRPLRLWTQLPTRTARSLSRSSRCRRLHRLRRLRRHPRRGFLAFGYDHDLGLFAVRWTIAAAALALDAPLVS